MLWRQAFPVLSMQPLALARSESLATREPPQMSRYALQRWSILAPEIAKEGELCPQSASLTSPGRWLLMPLHWIERRHQRKQLGELAALNNYLLRDIGLSQDEALREAAKPFWR